MLHAQLKTVAESLLRGGVAPRHVRRYVDELSDHYDDLVAAACNAGTSQADAERDALARIGTPNDLVTAMLARDDLKSLASKYPALVFSVGPTVGLALGLGIFILALMAVIVSFRPQGESYSVVPENWRVIVGGWIFIGNYLMPILVAALIAKIGLEHRMRSQWILIGIGIAGFIGGFMDLGVQWPAVPGGPGEINFGLGLMPPYPNFGHGLGRAAMNILIVALPTLWLLRRQSDDAEKRHF